MSIEMNMFTNPNLDKYGLENINFNKLNVDQLIDIGLYLNIFMNTEAVMLYVWYSTLLEKIVTL